MTSSLWQIVRDLLTSQRVGVLGSSQSGRPYASLVAYLADEDGRCIYFVTTRTTRKYTNLTEDRHVSFLVDNRSNRVCDLVEACAATAYGQAEEVPEEQWADILDSFIRRHPQLREFVRAPSSALFRVRVDCYHLVRHFQEVTEFRFNG